MRDILGTRIALCAALFDPEVDPGEKVDLIRVTPAVAERLIGGAAQTAGANPVTRCSGQCELQPSLTDLNEEQIERLKSLGYIQEVFWGSAVKPTATRRSRCVTAAPRAKEVTAGRPILSVNVYRVTGRLIPRNATSARLDSTDKSCIFPAIGAAGVNTVRGFLKP